MVEYNAEFLKRLSDGDNAAWDEVRRACFLRIYSYVKDRDLAMDIAQQTCMKIWEYLPTFHAEKGRGSLGANLRAWINRICFNTLSSFMKERKKEIMLDDMVDAWGMDSSDIVRILNRTDAVFARGRLSYVYHEGDPASGVVMNEIVSEILKLADDRKKKALILRCIYGHTIDEIANIMNENFDAVQTLMYRALAKLRENLSSRDIDISYPDDDEWKIRRR